MSDIGHFLTHHPWWAVAAVATPVAMALWVIVGGLLLEARHGDEISGHGT